MEARERERPAFPLSKTDLSSRPHASKKAHEGGRVEEGRDHTSVSSSPPSSTFRAREVERRPVAQTRRERGRRRRDLGARAKDAEVVANESDRGLNRPRPPRELAARSRRARSERWCARLDPFARARARAFGDGWVSHRMPRALRVERAHVLAAPLSP